MPIVIDHLTHTYYDGATSVSAVKDVCLEIREGEFLSIIGHTGCGKTTLVQHLNGLLLPSSGRVLVDGLDTTDKKQRPAVRSLVGMVFQYPEYQLFEETVYKDIAFGPKNMGLKEEEIDRRVREAAKLVGLTEKQLEVSPFDLSGGQKRRVAIAGVIAMEPEVLILDEPTAGLDPASRAGILENIETYRKTKNATIMMVSHSMNDVARLTDRLLVLCGSKIAMDGPPTEVFTRADELLEMGLDIPDITRVFLRLKQMGLNVEPVYTMEQAVETIKKLKEGK